MLLLRLILVKLELWVGSLEIGGGVDLACWIMVLIQRRPKGTVFRHAGRLFMTPLRANQVVVIFGRVAIFPPYSPSYKS